MTGDELKSAVVTTVRTAESSIETSDGGKFRPVQALDRSWLRRGCGQENCPKKWNHLVQCFVYQVSEFEAKTTNRESTVSTASSANQGPSSHLPQSSGTGPKVKKMNYEKVASKITSAIAPVLTKLNILHVKLQKGDMKSTVPMYMHTAIRDAYQYVKEANDAWSAVLKGRNPPTEPAVDDKMVTSLLPTWKRNIADCTVMVNIAESRA